MSSSTTNGVEGRKYGEPSPAPFQKEPMCLKKKDQWLNTSKKEPNHNPKTHSAP